MSLNELNNDIEIAKKYFNTDAPYIFKDCITDNTTNYISNNIHIFNKILGKTLTTKYKAKVRVDTEKYLCEQIYLTKNGLTTNVRKINDIFYKVNIDVLKRNTNKDGHYIIDNMINLINKYTSLNSFNEDDREVDSNIIKLNDIEKTLLNLNEIYYNISFYNGCINYNITNGNTYYHRSNINLKSIYNSISVDEKVMVLIAYNHRNEIEKLSMPIFNKIQLYYKDMKSFNAEFNDIFSKYIVADYI